MGTNITLYIGPDPHAEERRYTDPHLWESVRSQIETAVAAGRGLIKVPAAQGGERVYVYSPTLHITWLDRSTPE